MSTLNIEFKKAIADYLNLPSYNNVSLFWKGRVALYAILKALGIQEGDEVILPAFTCVVVANPIIYLKARPVYVDIDPLTYNMDLEKLKKAITNKTKVILAQNTFGLAPELDAILEIAKEKNIFVVEDCAHGFGGFYKNNKNGTIADASFFSTQWNKPFSTGIGGIAVTKDKQLAEKIQNIEKMATTPTFTEKTFLSLLVFVKEKLLVPRIYWSAINTYRFLSNHNLIIGSSQGGELEKPEQPKKFLKLMSDLQAKKGQKALKSLDKLSLHRQKTANFYSDTLKSLGIEPPFVSPGLTHTYLKYPLLVKNRKDFFEKARESKVELGDWFISPIHPIERNFHLWNYKYGSFPISETISKHIVNLPTHLGINEKELEKIKKFLNENVLDIYKNYREIK